MPVIIIIIIIIIIIFHLNSNFLDRFSKNTEIQNFITIRPVGAELFHADGQAWRS